MDKRQHIVVVEDEAAQRQLLLDYLSRQGFRVTGFESGAGLRRMVERELPALVLLDVGLPGEDGFAVALVNGFRPLDDRRAFHTREVNIAASAIGDIAADERAATPVFRVRDAGEIAATPEGAITELVALAA